MAALNCLIFKINTSLYAVDAGMVVGVENNPALQKFPGQPSFINGLAEIRGVLTPVISVRSHFGLPSIDTRDKAVLVIKDEKGQKAYQTDGVEAITYLDFDDSSKAPQLIRSFAACVQKVTMLNGQPVILMDLPTILTENETNALNAFVDAISEQKEEE